jgi:glycerophosphoryl diester phosphodiesterase
MHTIAHRGASAYEPENTLRAFETAIRMGATMLELDLHLTRDGELIVLHDPEISRTTDGAGDVSTLTLAEAQAFDAGKGEHLPSLREVIALARSRAQLYTEMKGLFTPEPLVELLRQEHFCDDVIAGSFLPWLPQKVKWLAPEVRTSLLFKDVDALRMIAWARSIGADYVHPCWEDRDPQPHRLLTPEMIQEIRRAELGVILWHEERPDELRALARLDVDGICTNAPDALRDVLEMPRKAGETMPPNLLSLPQGLP